MSGLSNVKVGDTVVRVLGGIQMPLKVSAVDDALITCGPWQFERASGLEYDPELLWGSQWGASGSYIKEPPQ